MVEDIAGRCRICSAELRLGEPKRVATNRAFIICAHHPRCEQRVLTPILRRARASLVYVSGKKQDE